MKLRRVLLPSVLFTIASFTYSLAYVGPTTFSEMVRKADSILLAQVIEVRLIDGLRVARAIPFRIYKGPVESEFYFLAQSTWTCDISAADRGETSLVSVAKLAN
jgi:hypothetical protein